MAGEMLDSIKGQQTRLTLGTKSGLEVSGKNNHGLVAVAHIPTLHKSRF
jgi:hypothetical protein